MTELVYGFGINDAEYKVNAAIPGKGGKSHYKACPYYQRWINMIKRCYKTELEGASYADKYVSDEWVRFSKFKAWMETQNHEGLQLDKDILVPGNKEYGPNTCCFVPMYVNNCLIASNPDKKSDLPFGVYFLNFIKKTDSNRYSSSVKGFASKTFDTSEKAHKYWQWHKAEYIEGVVAKYAKEPSFRTDVAEALTQRVWKLRLDHTLGLETKKL